MSPAYQPNVAVPIELPFQINAQGNAVLLSATGESQVFVSLWDEQGYEMPHLGKFRFINAWASEYFATENGGSYLTADSAPYGFLARIESSTWLAECIKRRLSRYPNWLQWDKRNYHHFMVHGHDNYVQIIAEQFEISFATEAENNLFYDLCV
jgi:hypothetical protein